ncbi:MAG TPA: hypothetical protein VIU62_05180 [Chloroflexota bacterium]
MTISLVLYLIAAVCFFIACVDWKPFSDKAVAVGLLFFTLGHMVSGISFKAS